MCSANDDEHDGSYDAMMSDRISCFSHYQWQIHKVVPLYLSPAAFLVYQPLQHMSFDSSLILAKLSCMISTHFWL